MSSEPSQWIIAMVLAMISLTSYLGITTFYAAQFPRLARNTPHSRLLREKLRNGEISPKEYDLADSLETNNISNMTLVRISQFYDRY